MQEKWREFVELKFDFLLPHSEVKPIGFGDCRIDMWHLKPRKENRVALRFPYAYVLQSRERLVQVQYTHDDFPPQNKLYTLDKGNVVAGSTSISSPSASTS